jgi:phage gpG-like protein
MELLDFDWDPLPTIVAAEYDTLGGLVKSFEEPLKRSVREVMAPSLGTNFNVGGRPSWQPLANTTVLIKGGGRTLIRTGALAGSAADPSIWDISSDQAAINSVPQDYGLMHQTGTRRMPAREWAVIQDEDAVKVEEVFDEWLLEEIEAAIRTGLI